MRYGHFERFVYTRSKNALVLGLALRVMPADRLLVFEAAHVKARYPVSYADAFSVALAKQNHGRVMTGDPEFKAVESEVRVHWLPDGRR